MSLTHPNGGNLVWTCVKYNITEDKEYWKYIGLHRLDYKIFEEDWNGGLGTD